MEAVRESTVNNASNAFDFETVIDRRGTGSLKWDGAGALFDGAQILPMWVADMDFASPEAVSRAIATRTGHPVYGYRASAKEAKEAMADHFTRRHAWSIDPKILLGVPAVVPGMAFAVAAFSNPGDGVIVQPPVYPPFFDVVRNQGRTLVENPLRTGEGRFHFDFDDLERKAPLAKMLLLSNPHNPGGRVWTRSELERLVEICRRHRLLIISDEIHCDIVYAPAQYTPILQIEGAEECVITALSPGKTFNIAGLKAAFLAIPQNERREQLARFLDAWHLGAGNEFGLLATEAAYRHGEPWLDALLARLSENRRRICSFFEKELPHIPCMRPEGTFLVWLDFRAVGSADEVRRRLIHEAHLGLNDGRTFGTSGEGFFRLNFGCPPATLEEGLARLGKIFGHR